MSRRAVLIAVVVVVVVAVAGVATLSGSSARRTPATGPVLARPGAADVSGASTAAPAPVVKPERLPGLRGRAPQRDISRSAPSVRAYERTHRLLNATPLTYRGVSFDVGGRTTAGRVLITASPNGLPAATARRVYRRLLRHLHDPGTAYVLRVLIPEGAAS